MKLSDGVEWAAHCVMLLGALPAASRLSGKAMAEFHGVPESYLLKHLKTLTASGILNSAPGPNGGYSLARPAGEISLLDVVDAVEGTRPAFRCTDIRRRGPCAIDDPAAYARPCGINRAMLRAEADYRAALARETMNELIDEFVASVDPRIAALGQEWAEKNIRTIAE
ncbi:RrF2 family transcriptional regulator [Bauldia sp.]|uniref:RrF2 family transcriptional regulator n=1 Tax=Bauldia sp. TaxID=2575872 RepID=UPI003BA85981